MKRNRRRIIVGREDKSALNSLRAEKSLQKRIIAACGNDCSACPRYVAHPFEKTEEELHHTADLKCREACTEEEYEQLKKALKIGSIIYILISQYMQEQISLVFNS